MSRQLLVTIDGDGSWAIPWIENIYKIVESYPSIKFTVSLITAYLDGTLRPEMRETVAEALKPIFKLPNVEPASHTHTHPRNWLNQGGENLPSTPWTIEDEVNKSVTIMKNLIGVKPKLLLLSGDSNPNGKQVETMYRLGVTPFGGGIKEPHPFRLVDGYRVYNQRGLPDVHFHGVRKWKNGVAYLDEPNGYRNAVFWFREHPEYPIHIFFHFYAGEFKETVDSVKHVLDWCSTQETETLYLSDYIKKLL